MNWNDVIYFSQKEWGPGSDKLVPKLVFLLDAIRHEVDRPCIVHCAMAMDGHSPDSWHYKGGAVDFHFVDNDYRRQFDIIQSFDDVGGIGVYMDWAHPGFHMDIRPNRLYWTQRNGVYVYDLASVLEDIHAKNV